MTDSSPTRTIQRILVALDASAQSTMAIEAAAALAAQLEAELSGIFVEDIQLLHLAESPYAREILYASAKGAPLSRAAMESTLKAQAERARSSLAASAEQFRVRWSFRNVRGQVASELLSAAGEADLLALGVVGWSCISRRRIGSTALEAAASEIPVLLVSEGGVPRDAKLLVLYDGSPTARHGLAAAADLARGRAIKMAVLLATAQPDHIDKLREEAGALAQAQGVAPRFRAFDSKDRASLLRALEAEKPAILVLGGRPLLKTLPSIEALVSEAGMPLLLLSDGFERESE